MAKNEKESKNPLVRGIRSLNNITKATNTTTYGVGRDVASVLMNNVDDAIDKINEDSEKNKSLINSHMTRMKLQQSKQLFFSYFATPYCIQSESGTLTKPFSTDVPLLWYYTALLRRRETVRITAGMTAATAAVAASISARVPFSSLV